MKSVFSILLLAFIFSSCAMTQPGPSQISKFPAGQCLLDYKVSYEHNDVPEWDKPPADFCEGGHMLAVPFGIGIYPLKYQGKVMKSKVNLTHADSWFYVVWGCYGPCELFSKN